MIGAVGVQMRGREVGREVGGELNLTIPLKAVCFLKNLWTQTHFLEPPWTRWKVSAAFV